jgi:drug/metabolite transporter (DMT)-like permease
MPIGLLYGLGAALAWGFADVAAALAGRRRGSLQVLAGAQLVALAVLGSLVVIRDVDPFAMPSSTLAFVIGLGCLSAFAYLAFFTALRLGPVAIVSPVVAAFGGLTVVLAVIFRNESLTVAQAIGATIATAGIVLTGVVVDSGWRGVRLRGSGVAFGLVAMVLFAILTVATAGPINEVGWLPVMALSRASNTVLAWGFLAFALVVRPRAADPSLQVEQPDARRGLGLAVVAAAGLLDVLGLISFAIGLEVAETWLVGLASSFGPVVAVLVAVAFMHERLRPIQWFGLALLGVGLLAIAVS